MSSPAASAPRCLHPGADGGEYQIIVRFSDGLMLRVWERSAIRNELMERADKFVTGTRMSADRRRRGVVQRRRQRRAEAADVEEVVVRRCLGLPGGVDHLACSLRRYS